MSSPPPSRLGIDWPPSCEGKTTQPAKEIWAAVARACGDETVATDILNEKNWRFGYIKHVVRVYELLGELELPDAVAKACQAGLSVSYDQFVFRSSESEAQSLTDLVSSNSSSKNVKSNSKVEFKTRTIEVVSPSKSPEPVQITLPYRNKSLASSSEILTQVKVWADYGTCEPSCVQDIAAGIKHANPKFFSDGKKCAVILGAGSELGPTKSLIKWGCPVIAVRTRKSAEWDKLEKFVMEEGVPGSSKLFIPESGSERGADIMTETVDILKWIISVVEAEKYEDITVGMYTYLDGEAHVRVSLGCDIIQQGLINHFSSSNVRVRLAYLGSNSCPVVVGREAVVAMGINRKESPFWMRMSWGQAPGVSVCEKTGIQLVHGLSELQGPNYALAKTLQFLRAMVYQVSSSSSNNFQGGIPVSFNVAPACKTASVVGGKNVTLKHLMNGLELVKPNEAFDPETAATLMGLLLVRDMSGAKTDSDSTHCHPLAELTKNSGCFHGGSCRSAFNLERARVVGAGVYVYGRWWNYE